MMLATLPSATAAAARLARGLPHSSDGTMPTWQHWTYEAVSQGPDHTPVPSTPNTNHRKHISSHHHSTNAATLASEKENFHINHHSNNYYRNYNQHPQENIIIVIFGGNAFRIQPLLLVHAHRICYQLYHIWWIVTHALNSC